MHEIRTYALAAMLLLFAFPSQAGLPSHKDLTRALEARPTNPEIVYQARIMAGECCKDAWERFDRYGGPTASMQEWRRLATPERQIHWVIWNMHNCGTPTPCTGRAKLVRLQAEVAQLEAAVSR